MTKYYEDIENLFEEPKERTFTDRTEILELLNESLTRINEESVSLQIININGIGGIGKTRLVKEFSKIITPEPVVFVSFEINKRNEIINNLYRIRKEIKYSCPFFDYSLLRYWEMTNPTLLDDTFMDLFKKGFFVTVLDFVAEIANTSVSALNSRISLPSVVTPSTIVDFMNTIYRKAPQFLHSSIFKTISLTSANQLIEKLPTLLGLEINHLISLGKITNPVFIFDSYQESQPYSESEEWLYNIIKAAGKGLYIVTSREPLHWKGNDDSLIPQNLQCYPEDDARKLLEETIKNRPDLVAQIIESTQCVPIYIDLALNIYESEKTIVGEKLIEKALFNDRHMLVKHFVNHMKPSWQSVVFDLATIRVFNNEIFQHLINCRMLDCYPYEYTSIIQSNLINYVSNSKDSDLLKLHDIFCRDVQRGRPAIECYTIFRCYLEYICYRRDLIISKNKGASLVILFQNAISIAIELEERLFDEGTNSLESRLDTTILEQLLDIFFTLVTNRILFIPIPYESIKTERMKKVCQFIYIKTYEKLNTRNTINVLEQLGDISCFGKHVLSYEAVLLYTRSLVGYYNELEDWINQVDNRLDDQTKHEWFYNRIKIYQADCDLMKGRFNSALKSLFLLSNSYITTDDYYSIYRTIGHIQRFNFQLVEARSTYSDLMKKYHHNSVYREYLAANLAETQCYFPNNDFIKHNKKVLESMKSPYNAKNKGKVLYALAIANTVKKHYRKAQACIDECVMINHKDGYQSGELFAFVAQAYLDYALTGIISSKTDAKIEHLLNCNKVYTFFRLQLAIMRNDKSLIISISQKYQWLDFENTEAKCRQFLRQLRDT